MKTKGIFFKNIGTILIYAVFGTLINIFFIGGFFSLASLTLTSCRPDDGGAVQPSFLRPAQFLRHRVFGFRRADRLHRSRLHAGRVRRPGRGADAVDADVCCVMSDVM